MEQATSPDQDPPAYFPLYFIAVFAFDGSFFLYPKLKKTIMPMCRPVPSKEMHRWQGVRALSLPWANPPPA